MTHRSVPALFALFAFAMGACTVENPNNQGPPADPPVCSGIDCCKPEELVCRGDPDGQTVCTCHRSWDCDSNLSPEKCTQSPADTPDGKQGWSCQVKGALEQCTRPGSDLPPGKNSWTCKQAGGKVVCTRPTNTPNGSTGWDCSYAGELKVCNKNKGSKQDSDVPPPKLDGAPPPPPPPPYQDAAPPPPPPPPGKDSGPPPPKPDQGVPPTGWSCSKGPNGENICKKSGGGLPGGNGDFKCYWNSGTITCEGSSSSPPGGAGWTCVKHDGVGGWRCTKKVGSGDMPPGGGKWSCTSSTSQGGTTCVQAPPPKPGAECLPGTKKWCDGHSYCGWGIVTCGPDGKWKRKFNLKTFKWELDCWEPADGRRPNTQCACYFFYYNTDCCETPDCIIPAGTNGQICPASAGGYCDFCNPQKSECKEPGAKCITTTNSETYCGRDCSGGKPCPQGSKCTAAKQGSKTFWQCVPKDLSCYY
jgi:hypothetical protein